MVGSQRQHQSAMDTRDDISSTSKEEELSAIIGQTGVFQRILLLYEMVAMLAFALHNLLYSLVAPTEDYWCKLPEPPTNVTEEDWKNRNIPKKEDGTYSQCFMYDQSLLETSGGASRVQVPCEEWVYEQEFSHQRTIVHEWNLVCDKMWLISASASVYVSGSLMGLLVSGILSDRIGRKLVICLSCGMLEVTGFMVSMAKTFTLFVMLRFFVSCAVTTVTYTGYILMVELVPSEKRSLYGTSINYGFIAGMLVSFLIGRLRLDWRYTQLAIMVPTTVLLTFFP